MKYFIRETYSSGAIFTEKTRDYAKATHTFFNAVDTEESRGLISAELISSDGEQLDFWRARP